MKHSLDGNLQTVSLSPFTKKFRDDAVLLELVKQGDDAALREVIQKHTMSCYAAAKAYLQSGGMAEDVIVEVANALKTQACDIKELKLFIFSKASEITIAKLHQIADANVQVEQGEVYLTYSIDFFNLADEHVRKFRDDVVLLNLIKQGDEDAWFEIYRKYSQACWKAADFLLKSPTLSDRVVKETFDPLMARAKVIDDLAQYLYASTIELSRSAHRDLLENYIGEKENQQR